MCDVAEALEMTLSLKHYHPGIQVPELQDGCSHLSGQWHVRLIGFPALRSPPPTRPSLLPVLVTTVGYRQAEERAGMA